VKNNGHRANLAKPDSLITQNLETRLRKGYAIHSTLKSRKSFLFTGFVLDSAEEVRKCFMHSVRYILLDLRMNFRIFASKIFVVIKLPQSLASVFIGLFRKVKKFVVDCLASLERINDSNLLLLRRIYPKSIHSHRHTPIKTLLIFKYFGGLRLIHPTTEVVGILSPFL
jgi:hypothetical protein